MDAALTILYLHSVGLSPRLPLILVVSRILILLRSHCLLNILLWLFDTIRSYIEVFLLIVFLFNFFLLYIIFGIIQLHMVLVEFFVGHLHLICRFLGSLQWRGILRLLLRMVLTLLLLGTLVLLDLRSGSATFIFHSRLLHFLLLLLGFRLRLAQDGRFRLDRTCGDRALRRLSIHLVLTILSLTSHLLLILLLLSQSLLFLQPPHRSPLLGGTGDMGMLILRPSSTGLLLSLLGRTFAILDLRCLERLRIRLELLFDVL